MHYVSTEKNVIICKMSLSTHFCFFKADAPILDDGNIVPVLVSAAFLKVNYVIIIIFILNY